MVENFVPIERSLPVGLHEKTAPIANPLSISTEQKWFFDIRMNLNRILDSLIH